MAETYQVLLVDDDPNILRLFKAHLQAANLTVDTAMNGDEALKKLADYFPEVIVSDVQMPGMSGYDLCRRVRLLKGLDMPFFFCSTLSSLPERIGGLRSGADDYLVKPVDPDELVLKVLKQVQKNKHLRALKQFAEAGTLSENTGLLSGELTDMWAIDVLQLLETRARDEVRIEFEGPHMARGYIWLRNGEIVHAETGRTMGPKAFFRLLAWNQGTFKVEERQFRNPPTMSGRLSKWLLEATPALDEYKLLRKSIHNIGNHFEVTMSKEMFSSHFSERTMQLLTLVDTDHYIDLILDNSPTTDLETMRLLMEMITLKLVAGKASSAGGATVMTTHLR